MVGSNIAVTGTPRRNNGGILKGYSEPGYFIQAVESVRYPKLSGDICVNAWTKKFQLTMHLYVQLKFGLQIDLQLEST